MGESEQHAICPQQLSRPSPHGPRITTWSTLRYGERPEVAYGLPFSVDGMLVVATIVMVDDKRRTHRVRPMARLAFTADVIASIAANIAAAHPTVGARIIDGWPALALLLVVEMLARPPAGTSPAHVRRKLPEPPVLRRNRRRRLPDRRPELPPLSRRRKLQTVDTFRRNLPSPIPRARTCWRLRTFDTIGPAAVADTGTAALAVANRHLRVAGSTDAAPPAVQGIVNTRPAQQEPPSWTNAGVNASSAPAVPADLRFGSPDGAAELPTRALPAANFRPEVPPAELPADLLAAELPVAEPAPLPPAEPRAIGAASAAPELPSIRRDATIRRPTATTRHLAHTILAAEPQLSRTELAERLGVSTRRLREVLAA